VTGPGAAAGPAGGTPATSLPQLAAGYQALPGRPADGYPAVSRLLLGQLSTGFPAAVAMQVRSGAEIAYTAAGGWARLADATAGAAAELAVLPGAPPSPVTISDCLLHTAGLVPFRQYYRTCSSPADIRRAVVAELARADAGSGQVSYSDVGFMLLGWAVEQCAGQPLPELFRREVAGPLGLTSTGYRPQVPRRRIAAAEADGDQRTRPGLIWGEVHDGNAFALSGVSGHAGLFGTAADLGRFAAALLRPDHHPFLSAATLDLTTSRLAGTGAEERVLGWRVRPQGWGSWPDGTIWHTGFTGTSLLVAPALDAAVVLLTNAVHPVRRLADTAQLRALVHQQAAAALSAA
jgi:serine-type D-Ala-D-Ala carboxypeptidase